jgi:type IV pilus assembly protein PilB
VILTVDLLAMSVKQAPVVHGGSRLGERLVDAKVLTGAQVALALEEQQRTGKRLGTVLIESGAIDERTLLSALGMQLHLPIIDLRHHSPTRDALDRVPEALVRALNVLPMSLEPDRLEVVAAEPPDDAVSAELERAAGVPLRILLAPRNDIRLAIDGAYADVNHEVSAQDAPALGPAARPAATAWARLTIDPDQDANGVFYSLITHAWHAHATDVHLDAQLNTVRVRCRVDGALRETTSVPLEQGMDVLDRIKALGHMDICETRQAQLGAIDLEVDGQRLDIRVATVGTALGEKATLRLRAPERAVERLGDLGMTPEGQTLLRRLAGDPFGLVICAGPKRSGRTTTLYAALAEADTPERSVFSIERHLEHVVLSVNQLQVGEPEGLTLADGIRAALHQDADVILVDELAEAEAASLAVQAAVDGRVVLASLQAGDAVGALRRVLEMGIDPAALAAGAALVVGQRLVRRVCVACAAPYVPPPLELAFFRHRVRTRKTVFVHGEGCEACAGSGYRGRTGVFEMLRVDDRIRDLIANRAMGSALHEAAAASGMRTLQDECLRLVNEDVATIAEIIRSLSALEVQR